jgi:hypothetical protein
MGTQDKAYTMLRLVQDKPMGMRRLRTMISRMRGLYLDLVFLP